MDSVTHMVLGAALGEATLGRRLKGKAAIWGAALAIFPDLDVLIRHGDPVADFVYHRSFTHSLVILTLLAPLFALLVQRVHRLPRTDYLLCLLFCWLILCTHALLDALTVYGTQLLWPIDTTPVMWSTIFIIDPAYTLPLLIGLTVHLVLARRRTARPGASRPRWPVLIGLLVSSLYLAWTVAAKLQIEAAVDASLKQQQINPTAVMTVPAPANTLLWRIVVMTDSHYLEGFRSLLDRSDQIRFRAFPRQLELIEPLQEHWPVGKLEWFTHGFHAASEENGQILITDLRMGQEPAYAFRFQVGERRRGIIMPVAAAQQPMELDLGGLGWVWQRIWDEELPPRQH